MTSKNLLRHPQAKSHLRDMAPGKTFQRVIADPAPLVKDPSAVKRVLFCSGQVYYALQRAREFNASLCEGVVLHRVEQLSPFPYDLVLPLLQQYPADAEIVWCQEEPMNAGAWQYVEPRFVTALAATASDATMAPRRPSYAGRPPSASVATGNKKQHLQEERTFLSKALLGRVEEPKEMKLGIPVW